MSQKIYFNLQDGNVVARKVVEYHQKICPPLTTLTFYHKIPFLTSFLLIYIIELLQIKNFKGDFKIAKILKYPNEVRLKLIKFKGEKVILQHV